MSIYSWINTKLILLFFTALQRVLFYTGSHLFAVGASNFKKEMRVD